jgi:Syd protein.
MAERLALTETLASLFSEAETRLGPFSVEDDPSWPSPCLEDERLGNQRRWRPTRQQPRPDAPLAGLGEALGQAIPESLQAFYSSFYSDPIPLPSPWGALSLTLPWSEAEWPRLLENQLGHCLQQKRFRLPMAPFIAVQEDEGDGIVSVLLATGEVVLEGPGRRERETLAPDLNAFLTTLLAHLRNG